MGTRADQDVSVTPMFAVHPVPRDDAMPSVSALIAAWNESDLIRRCIESLLEVRSPQLELVICAGGEDGTYRIAREYASPRVIVIEQYPNEGKQSALRRAFAASHGEIIYLTDADCIVSAQAIRTLIAPILSGEFLAATGRTIPLPEQQSNSLVRYQWARDANWAEGDGPIANGVLGRNAAVHRSVLERFGPFDQDVASGTDYHLTQVLHRANIPIANTASYVFSEFPERPGEYVWMWRRWIRNVLIQSAQSRSYRELAIAATGVGIALIGLTLPALAVLIDRRLGIPWLALFGTIVWRRYEAQKRMERRGRLPMTRFLLARTPWYVILDWVAAIYALLSCLIPSMRKKW
jgi:cellulose synthase/poly-beta-1,6-N-acetylglucosamine synthase-like glycosyltransferase